MATTTRVNSPTLGHYLGRLQKLKSEYALEVLLKAKDDESLSQLARHAGYVQGLNRAEQLLLETEEAEKDDERE